MVAARLTMWFLLPGLLLVHTAVFAQNGTGSIVGQVLGPEGTPAMNVRVVALELPKARGLYSGEPIAVETTDAEGRYRLSGVPPGRYGVFTNIRTSYDVSASEMDAAPAVIVRSGASTVHDLSLPSRGVTVSGRVELNSRENEVFLSAGNRLLRTRIGLDGSFSFRDVSAGTYSLTIPGAQFAWGSRRVLVEDQNITGLELHPEESFPVMGRVVIEGGGPVPAFGLSLDGPKGSAFGGMWIIDSVRSNPVVGVGGSWSDQPDDVIFNASLPVGEYRIALTGLPAGYRIKSFTYGATDLLDTPLNLTGEIRQFSIILIAPEASRFVKVSGRLIRDVALPLEMATERVVLSGSHLLTPLETAFDKDGSFEFSQVPPGIYWVTPVLGSKIVVGREDVRGLEIRNSRIRARYEESVRAAASPPQRTAVIEEAENPPEQEARSRVEIEDAAVGPSAARRFTVAGRVTGADPVPLNALRVVLSGTMLTATVDPDGRFVFPEVPSGLYTIFANSTSSPYREASNIKRIVVRDGNVEGIELSAFPPPKKTISGRIVVEGGYPLPIVALTVRPNVDAGPPFTHPYTMRSVYPSDGGFVLQADGHFAIELPEGRHRLRVDGSPNTAYRVKSITYGSRSLNKNLLQIDGGSPKELVITFSADPPVFWPKVTGRVAGFSAFPEPVRVVLSSTRTMFKLEAAPRADGSFEFPKVPPDKYTVLTNPRVTMMAPLTIVVEGREVPPVNFAIPALRNVNLRIVAQEGSPPPSPSLSMTFNQTEAYLILLPGKLVLRTASETVCVWDSCTRSSELRAGAPVVLSASPNDGRYTLRLPDGEYGVDLGSTPTGYQVQSFTQGTADLLKEPLRVGPSTQDIVVSLRRR